jgi:hypothetical protein
MAGYKLYFGVREPLCGQEGQHLMTDGKDSIQKPYGFLESTRFGAEANSQKAYQLST